MNKNKSNKIELAFLFYAAGLAAIIAFAVLYSLIFLSGKMFHAFSTDDKPAEKINYNIEDFKKLGF